MASKLIADYDLGSNEVQARAQMAELQKQYPNAKLQFSQHAPEGYDGAYSVQVFGWEPDKPYEPMMGRIKELGSISIFREK